MRLEPTSSVLLIVFLLQTHFPVLVIVFLLRMGLESRGGPRGDIIFCQKRYVHFQIYIERNF